MLALREVDPYPSSMFDLSPDSEERNNLFYPEVKSYACMTCGCTIVVTAVAALSPLHERQTRQCRSSNLFWELQGFAALFVVGCRNGTRRAAVVTLLHQTDSSTFLDDTKRASSITTTCFTNRPPRAAAAAGEGFVSSAFKLKRQSVAICSPPTMPYSSSSA